MNKRLFPLIFAGLLTASPSAQSANISLGQVVLRGLDKVTGRLSTMTVNVGEKAQFGALDIYVRVCMTRPPEETPENAAFLQVIEKKPEGQLKLFSGWMFSSSPALSAMEHPVYDVWVIKCQGEPVTPPSPAPLILDNPLEMQTVLPKVKIAVDDEETESLLPDAPVENVQGTLSGADAETMLIKIEEEGVTKQPETLPLPEAQNPQIDAQQGSMQPSLPTARMPSGEEIEVIEEPIEGNAPILRALPENALPNVQENVQPVPSETEMNKTEEPSSQISVSDGVYIPPEEGETEDDGEDETEDDNIAEIPDGRVLHIVPSAENRQAPQETSPEVSAGGIPLANERPVLENDSPAAYSEPETEEYMEITTGNVQENTNGFVSSPVMEKYRNDPVPSYGFDELPPMQPPADSQESKALRSLPSQPILRDENNLSESGFSNGFNEDEFQETVTEENTEY